MCQIACTGRRNSVPAASGVMRPVLTRRYSKHRTLKPASGAHRPVQSQNANLSAHESGGHRTRPVQHKERPVTPQQADKARAQGFRGRFFSFLSRFSPSRPSPSSQEPAPPPFSPSSGVFSLPLAARSVEGSLPHPSPPPCRSISSGFEGLGEFLVFLPVRCLFQSYIGLEKGS